MFVKAIFGIKVPSEFHPQRYITEHEISSVDESAYYVRRILDGDLYEVSFAEWEAQEQKRLEDEVAADKAVNAEQKAKQKAEKTALANT